MGPVSRLRMRHPPVEVADALEALVRSLPRDGWVRVVERFDEYHDATTYGDAVAARIGAALDEGRPASFVRLGDSEGAILGAILDRHPAIARFVLAEVSERNFGALDALGFDDADLFERYRASVVNAEVVGIPDPALFSLLDAVDDADAVAQLRTNGARAAFGALSVYEFLAALDAEGALPKVAAIASFNTPLLDRLPQLLAGRDVVLVTCHAALEAAVAERFAPRSVRLLPVPVQAVLRSSHVGATGHYPDRYRQLLDELAEVRPGSLVLIAAGVLAEVYCEAARSAGAVAVDVGSSVDIWAGERTRVLGQTRELYDAHQIL